MAIVRYVLDPANPPRFTAEELARLDAMTDEEIEANALSDPDNPPWTDEQIAAGLSGRDIRLARLATGMSQAEFARVFAIEPARLEEMEQGRYAADSAFLAYMRVIAADPEHVRRVLAA